jgi:hypothetical protein
MSLIGKPNRFFGAGETREQNAVIKVYSAAELKQALTRVYALPNGIGTIEIAGDIVLTEPVRLKRFLFGESAPKEVIIRGVSGSRILNGRAAADAGYAWDQAGNSSFPIFDFGAIAGSVNPVCKYTFTDLQVGSESGRAIGALIAGDIAVASTVSANDVGLITLHNIRLFNVWNIFAAYDSTGSFAANKFLSIINPKVTDILYRNGAGSGLTATHFNSGRMGAYSAYVSGVGVWNGGQFLQTEDGFAIVNNGRLQDCTFSNIYARVQITVPNRALVGQGNTITGTSQITATDVEAGFSYLNTNIGAPSSDGNTTFLRATSAALSSGSGGGYVVDTPTGQIRSVSGQWEHAQYTRGGGALIAADLPDTITYCQYTVDFILTARVVSTGATNAYHIRVALKIDAAGVGSMVNTHLVSASEETTAVTGLVPTWDNAAKRLSIAPTTGAGAGSMNCACTVRMSGLKHPSIG